MAAVKARVVGWDQIRGTCQRVGERRPTEMHFPADNGGPAHRDHEYMVPACWSHPTILSQHRQIFALMRIACRSKMTAQDRCIPRQLGRLFRCKLLCTPYSSAVRRLRTGPASHGPVGEPRPAGRPSAELNNSYVTGFPTPQQAVDIFRGEWSLAEIGGAKGKNVLELGPLEGGHTYMFHQAGAESIIAIEANTRAYLKCLIAKEIFGLEPGPIPLWRLP